MIKLLSVIVFLTNILNAEIVKNTMIQVKGIVSYSYLTKMHLLEYLLI